MLKSGMVRRLLATGVTGFVGTPCLRALLNGDFDEVHAVSRRGNGPVAPALRWHAADLRDEVAAVDLVQALRPTHLFHAAWIATPENYLTSPDNRAWMTSTVAMVRAFAEQGGQRFLGIGTAAEYAASAGPCVEDRTPVSPVSLYGETKALTWQSIETIAASCSMEALWARVFTPYGMGDLPQRLIPLAIAKLRAGEPVPLAVGDPQRDFVYTLDAARMLTGLFRGSATGVFNIGSGIPRTARSVVEAVADRLHMRARLRFIDLGLRSWEPGFLVADMRKVSGLGLLARTALPDALEDVIQAMP